MMYSGKTRVLLLLVATVLLATVLPYTCSAVPLPVEQEYNYRIGLQVDNFEVKATIPNRLFPQDLCRDPSGMYFYVVGINTSTLDYYVLKYNRDCELVASKKIYTAVLNYSYARIAFCDNKLAVVVKDDRQMFFGVLDTNLNILASTTFSTGDISIDINHVYLPLIYEGNYIGDLMNTVCPSYESLRIIPSSSGIVILLHQYNDTDAANTFTFEALYFLDWSANLLNSIIAWSKSDEQAEVGGGVWIGNYFYYWGGYNPRPNTEIQKYDVSGNLVATFNVEQYINSTEGNSYTFVIWCIPKDNLLYIFLIAYLTDYDYWPGIKVIAVDPDFNVVKETPLIMAGQIPSLLGSQDDLTMTYYSYNYMLDGLATEDEIFFPAIRWVGSEGRNYFTFYGFSTVNNNFTRVIYIESEAEHGGVFATAFKGVDNEIVVPHGFGDPVYGGTNQPMWIKLKVVTDSGESLATVTPYVRIIVGYVALRGYTVALYWDYDLSWKFIRWYNIWCDLGVTPKKTYFKTIYKKTGITLDIKNTGNASVWWGCPATSPFYVKIKVNGEEQVYTRKDLYGEASKTFTFYVNLRPGRNKIEVWVTPDPATDSPALQSWDPDPSDNYCKIIIDRLLPQAAAAPEEEEPWFNLLLLLILIILMAGTGIVLMKKMSRRERGFEVLFGG